MTPILIWYFFFQASILQAQTTQCECVHLIEQVKCNNSIKCKWNEKEERCKQSSTFSTQNIVTTYCDQFAEEECRVEKNCAFYLGKCREFVSCEAFPKEKCNQSSYQCITDGNICISYGQCSDYKTQIACYNKNLQGKFCKWIRKDQQFYCEDISECEDLPSNLKQDSDCREQIKKCTVSIKGGCKISSQFCNQYTQKEQCHFNLNDQQCFWDNNLNQCFEKVCVNKQSYLYEECQQIEPNCTTNGKTCIKKLECDQYQNLSSCVEDSKGNRCIYYQEKCYQKNCMNAPKSINTVNQCQLFDLRDVLCVPKQQGGCKIMPQKCDELETEDSCKYIIELDGQYCFWENNLKVCKIKQCSDAPIQYSHIECISWLNDYECIGDVDNGCMENVDDCTKILNPKSCFKDKFNRKCIFENGKCMEEKCDNFQFPYYDNIIGCENKLQICTFSIYSKMCINKECSQLQDMQCNFDYEMNKCIQLPGCIHKRCESASVYYGTNQECENWDIRCTVNIGVINGIPYRNGCITKYLECTDYIYESQCITSLQGIPCFWNQTDSKCQFHNCENAPLTLKTLEECQQWVQYHNIKCVNKQNGGCVQQSVSCQEIKEQISCLFGSEQGLCFWNASLNQCLNRSCEHLINPTTNLQCRIWLPSCIFNQINKCINDNGVQQLCKDALYPIQFLSHDECQAWNPRCTLKLGTACFIETICSNYKTQEACQFIQDGNKCVWENNYCYLKSCSNISPATNMNCLPQCRFSTTQQTTQEQCDDGTYNCSITTTVNKCEQKISNCTTITNQAECEDHSLNEKCIWQDQSCQSITCNEENSNQKNDDYCKNRQYNCILDMANQCEDLKVICSSVQNPTQNNCNSKNQKCIFKEDSNKCSLIQDCSETLTYYNYDCQNIIQNKRCQSKQFTSGCQALAENCSDYKQIEICQINDKRQRCYWSRLNNRCQDLACSIIEEKSISHQQCQQYFSECTLNFNIDTQPSCMDLMECENYLKKEQCFLNKAKQRCSWVKNVCILDNCKTAPLGIYTLQMCETQYGNSCTINENRSGCISKLDSCNQYNKLQCLTPNQRNFDEVLCFWDQSSGNCKEVLCHQASQQIKYLIDCEKFNQNCQTKLCKISICDDYKYDLDIQCSLALSNNKCTTDGTQCVDRRLCEDVTNKAGCTFSIKYEDCAWLEDENRCAIKTCDTASIQIRSHAQCQEYLQLCTNKIGGGCINITSCNSFSSKEACQFDQNQELCMWDFNNNQCLYLKCDTFCGDGVVGSLEECDDGNILPYDGCYKCRFQCQYGCNSCNKLKCQDCNQGFDLDQNGDCSEICGDGLIVGQEECDDMNDIQHDGCHLCKFQCHQDCLNCVFGFCNQCAFGFDQYDNQCRSVCGNGQLVKEFEQCDDGNIEDNDGCNSLCQIEQDWICSQSLITQISECQKILHPQMILQNLSQKRDSQQIIKLLFNQQVQLKTKIRLEDYLIINVTNNVQFQLIIQPIVEASQQLNYVEYNLYVTFLEKVNYPWVSIQFNQSILINQQNQELTKFIESISLGNPLILTLEQQSRLNSTIAFNEIMIYVFVGSSSLSILIGKFELFFDMLALLQQLSYFRQLSIPFPSHLDQYLKVFKVVSFQPLYDWLKIDDLFKKLNFGKSPFQKSKNNSKQDSELDNSFFLVNAKSFYLTMFLSLFFYLLAKLIIKFHKQIHRKLLEVKSPKLLKILYKLFHSFKYFAFKTSSYFIYSGLIKAFISAQYQLMYSAYIQFPEYKFKFDIENLFETFNSFNALVCIILPHIFLFKSVSVIQKQYNFESINQYSIFYENVKPNYWSRFLIPFSMIKVSTYMVIICFLYDSAIIQTISLSMLCSLFCYYLINVRPLIQKIELIKLLLKEITFLSIVSSMFPYCLSVTDDILNILGWIHIGLFSFIIGSNIILDSVKQVLHLLTTYSENLIKQERQERQNVINQLEQFIRIDASQLNIYNGPLSIGFEVRSNNQSQILYLD